MKRLAQAMAEVGEQACRAAEALIRFGYAADGYRTYCRTGTDGVTRVRVRP